LVKNGVDPLKAIADGNFEDAFCTNPNGDIILTLDPPVIVKLLKDN
jgi:hypothetical protein